ncbi:DUF3801 domain-containing protein [Parabacteroides distasonis]|nr:DUF3801 domain-containing protein [Parabacteroides distasonis]
MLMERINCLIFFKNKRNAMKNSKVKKLKRQEIFFKNKRNAMKNSKSEEAEKAGEIMQGLIEKVGLYAVENKSVSVDSIKDEFEIGNDDAKEIIGKLVTIGALEKSETENKYEAIMDRDSFTKRIKSYRSIADRIQAVSMSKNRSIADRIQAVSMSKNRNLTDITISKTLIKEESTVAVKTRVPGTKHCGSQDKGSRNMGRECSVCVDKKREHHGNS